MSEYIVTYEQLKELADLIREKGGTSESLVFPTGFKSAINEMGSGTTVTVGLPQNRLACTVSSPTANVREVEE